MPEPEKTENTPEPRGAKIDAVRQFVQMMKDNELTALDFIDGSTQIRLRRQAPEPSPGGADYPALGGFGSPTLVYQPGAYPPGPTAATPTPNPNPPVASAATPAPAPAPPGVVIESPMVGTYYSSSSPEAPSFVAVGTTVRGDTTVCIIEAMKVFTDIPAGAAIPAGSSGTITEILVKNGQSVEYGQPLFRVKLA